MKIENVQSEPNNQAPVHAEQTNERGPTVQDDLAVPNNDNSARDADTQQEDPQSPMATPARVDMVDDHNQDDPERKQPEVSMVDEVDSPLPRMPSLQDKYPFYGLLGDILRVIMPGTEADEMAISSHLMAALANVIGRRPYFKDGKTEHYLTLNIAVAAMSCHARKTSALEVALKLLRTIDPSWERNCRTVLPWADANIIAGIRALARTRGNRSTRSSSVTKNGRLLVLADNFGRILVATGHPDNTLSPVLRRLWSKGNGKTTVDGEEVRVANAHVGFVGHFNLDSSISRLRRGARKNGLASLFLWFFVRRSKCVPYSRWPTAKLEPLVLRLKKVVAFARTVDEMKRSHKAETLWADLHARLTPQPSQHPGLAPLKKHAPTHVMRLACVFALMDMSATVKTQHLRAAMKMWAFVDESIDFIFQGQS